MDKLLSYQKCKRFEDRMFNSIHIVNDLFSKKVKLYGLDLVYKDVHAQNLKNM